jgi:hypothetical protein
MDINFFCVLFLEGKAPEPKEHNIVWQIKHG